MTDDSEHLWGIIRILEGSCASRSERIDELEAENRDLRSALATIAERNAGAESRGSGGRAAGEPAGGDSDAGVASPPAAPEQSADVGKMVAQARREAPVLTNLTDPTILKEQIVSLIMAWGNHSLTLFREDMIADQNSRVTVSTTSAHATTLADRILALLPQPPARICLVCGASEPCMTEADLKPGDPGVPCTFDPTPQQLADAIRQRNEMIDELSKLLEDGQTMPPVCIGAETLRRLRTEGSVIVSGVALVAASDFPTDPTMPKVPTDAQWSRIVAALDSIMTQRSYALQYEAIRAALAKEQGR